MNFHHINAVGSINIQPLTTAQRISISNPVIGRLVYDTNLNTVYVGTGSSWAEIGSGGGGGGGVNVELQQEEFITGTPSGSYTGSVTEFILSVFTYTPGNTEILVFSNNVLMKKGTDYNEDVGGDRITFITDRATDEPVTVLKIASTPITMEFTELLDTPNTYAGSALKLVRVNAGETDLEFSDPAPQAFLDLSDTPASYTGHQTKFVRVNVAETALEFLDVPADRLEDVLAAGAVTNGNDILISAGDSILGPAGADLLITPDAGQAVYIDGKLTVTGLIDPTGLGLTPQASNPESGGLANSTIWYDNGTSKLRVGTTTLLDTSSNIADLNDVTISSISDGDVIQYVGSNNRFENKQPKGIIVGQSSHYGYACATQIGDTTLDEFGLINNLAYTATTKSSSRSSAGLFLDFADPSTIHIVSGGTLSFARENNPRLICKVRSNSTTPSSYRLFFGFGDSNVINNIATFMTADDEISNPYQYAGVQYSTSRPDTRFQVATKDGSTQSITDISGATYSSADFFIFDMWFNPTNNRFSVVVYDSDGILLGSVSEVFTNLPVSTTTLGLVFACYDSGSDVSLDIQYTSLHLQI